LHFIVTVIALKGKEVGGEGIGGKGNDLKN
jgi:hypothetical protein